MEKTEQTIEYAKENGAKQQGLERAKRVIKELEKKQMEKETMHAEILKEIPKEKLIPEEIKEKFGEKTFQYIKTLQQIEEIIDRNWKKLPPETLSSIVISIAQEFEPLIIKIMEEAETLTSKEKIIYENEYAKKAEEIWYPLATKLGLNDYAWKIQDFGFRATNPEGFEKIKKIINKTREEREKLIEEAKKEIEEMMQGKIETTITGRPKSFKSIYEKLKKVPIQKMLDIYGIRIICNKEKECYEALGYVHSKYEIIKEAFDDYIAKPKTNGYKGIHTAVKRGNDIIEIQIRTWQQHLRTEGENYWEYKQIKKDKEFEKELSWEKQLTEWQKKIGKETTGKKHAGKKIFVFTPKNEAIALPPEASVIDFAFAVHTEIGKKMEKAKINGKYVPIETKLNNLDQVEIITGKKDTLKKTWYNEAITDKAKTKIKVYFGIKKTKQKKQKIMQITDTKKIKTAECCHPLPGEEVIGVKTTKRKIVIHKMNCKNIQNLEKEKLVIIEFEKEKGKTEILVKTIDRPGILTEILEEIKNSGATLTNTNFKIKKTGYAEALFGIEIKSIEKLEKLIEKIENIPSVQSAERI
jgi:(p)ppGpp synthase/HD superfamily hydrolase